MTARAKARAKPKADSRRVALAAAPTTTTTATTGTTTKTARPATKAKIGAVSVIPFVPPQLATLVDRAPAGDDWLHEVKFDGFRILCRIQRGLVTLFTRTAQDWTARFAPVAQAAARLNATDAMLDGEIAVLRPDGTTSFQSLQNHLQGAGSGALTYFVFDLLFLDGRDLRPLPLEERKARLAGVLNAAGGSGDRIIRYTDHVVGNGPAFFQKASEAGLEGIVSKQRREPYRSGRTPGWVKTKALLRQEFVVGGFTEPEGSRSGIGALLVGVFQGGALVPAGKVGTGFTHKSAVDLRRRLDGLLAARSPFDAAVPGAGRQIRWVKPRMVVEIAFGEMTDDGKLRHPSYQGLREDKAASDVVRETPQRLRPPEPAVTAGRSIAPGLPRGRVPRDDGTPTARTDSHAAASSSATETVAAVKLTHPQRLMDASAGVTKRDLARYLEAVAPRMLPHLIGRPLSLVRCPEGAGGACFFMKHAAFATPALRRVTIKEKEGRGEYLIADTVSALVGLAQMSVLEIHTWNAVDDTLEQPDRVVFDFDPGPLARWQDVVEGARLVKERVERIGCACFVKTTGGKGLHLVVPLSPNAGWDDCRTFSQLVSESVVAQQPKRFTTVLRKAGREDKVLIDYFRNNRGATSVAAFSTRARPGLPVSVPITWEQVAAFSPARPFTMASTVELLAPGAADPWADYDARRVDLRALILNDREIAPGPPSARASATGPSKDRAEGTNAPQPRRGRDPRTVGRAGTRR